MKRMSTGLSLAAAVGLAVDTQRADDEHDGARRRTRITKRP